MNNKFILELSEVGINDLEIAGIRTHCLLK